MCDNGLSQITYHHIAVAFGPQLIGFFPLYSNINNFYQLNPLLHSIDLAQCPLLNLVSTFFYLSFPSTCLQVQWPLPAEEVILLIN
jgi:hypothetical protein